jgi:hypothetical protein
MIPRGRQQKSGDPLFLVSFVPETRFSLDVGKALLSGGKGAIAIFCAVVCLGTIILVALRSAENAHVQRLTISR